MNKAFSFLLLLMLTGSIVIAQSISSPDGQLQLQFSIKDSVPYYQLNYKGTAVIKTSKLGLSTVDVPSFLSGFAQVNQKTSSFNESWHPVMGEFKTIVNNYNELEVTLAQPVVTIRQLFVRFSVFNDGLGFR